jgi:hypothetical protein
MQGGHHMRADHQSNGEEHAADDPANMYALAESATPAPAGGQMTKMTI